MEDIPTGFTVRGVLAHVRDALRDVEDLESTDSNKLAQAAGGS